MRKDIDHEALKPAAWRIDALQVGARHPQLTQQRLSRCKAAVLLERNMASVTPAWQPPCRLHLDLLTAAALL